MELQEKFYSVGCYTSSGWDHIHEELTCDGCDDESCIPKRCVECCDEKQHSETRAVYLLTDEEAEDLKNHPDVKFVNLDTTKYPEIFKPPAKELYNVNFRYTENSKHYRDAISVGLPEDPDEADINRSGYQLLRCAKRSDEWVGIDTTIIQNRIPYTLDGTDVDVIVGDDGCWFGHPEFQSNTGNGPTNYRGGNVLPGNGTCDLLDLVLDAPYHIDPEWFDANPGSRLTTRWDGTIVPVESVARSWWSNSSQRSEQFSSIGTVSVLSTYTRIYNCGTNDTISQVGDHGTPCAALTYGRTQGWAFNANKWTLNVYNVNGIEIEAYFDMMKIFHLNKPINPKYGTKNPTVSSNSWGYRSTSHRSNSNPAAPNYYFYRQGTSGGVGVAYTAAINSNALTQGTIPNFMRYVGWYGDGLRMKGEHLPNSLLEAGEELINSGVIFVGAAGNSNQKQVSPSHPDYNNYWSTNAQGSNASLSNATHLEFGITAYNTVNRRGFPQQLGKTQNNEYPVINIGALDDDYQPNQKERKVDYSDMGNEIDVYAPADGTLTANRGYAPVGVRPDTYPGSSIFTIGAVGLASSSSFMTGDQLSLLPNSGRRITTLNNNSATITSITSSILGSASLTPSTTPTIGHPTYGAEDDGFWDITLPWNINFGNLTTDKVYVNTNSYVLFGTRPTLNTYDESIGWTYTQSQPPHSKIFITAADGSAQRIYFGTEGSAPNRTYRIRFEGHTDYVGGILGSPTIEWEIIFYENTPNQIDLQIGKNQRISPPTDTTFSGTSAACPVAAGLIATIMQENRDWDWRKLKKYLRTSMLTQTTTRSFYQGSESRTANDSNWADVNSLEGGKSVVIYNPQTNF
jgi:hypothetical protein